MTPDRPDAPAEESSGGPSEPSHAADNGHPRLPPSTPVGSMRIEAPGPAHTSTDHDDTGTRRRSTKPARPAKKRKRDIRPHAHRPSGSTGGEFLRALLFPGITTSRRAFVLGSLLVIIGILFPVFVIGWIIVERDDLLALALDNRFLLALMVGSVAAVLARLVAVTEVAVFRGRHESITIEAISAYVLLALLSVPIAYGVYQTDQARQTFDDIFVARSATPVYLPPGGVSEEFLTVLFLGSDGGPDRFGHRTDSMILVSVHRDSGRAGLISIPRNLVGVRFPPGTQMASRFPNGFNDLANAIYPYVAADASLHGDFLLDGLGPPEVAVTQAIGHSLGVQIDDYVFVDMAGFIEVIDALGGVAIDVQGVVPLPPNVVGAKREIPTSVGPGRVEMDGTLAIAYARSREADSDYARMGRQRQILSALASQVSIPRAAAGLPSIVDALADSLRTSTSRDEFATLTSAVSDGSRIVESVGLVPPLVQPGSPDWQRIREIVAEIHDALATGEPSGYTPEPADLSNG